MHVGNVHIHGNLYKVYAACLRHAHNAEKEQSQKKNI